MLEARKIERKAILFGSLKNGGHAQLHQIYLNGEVTDIMLSMRKENRNSEWASEVTRGEEEYETVSLAIDAMLTERERRDG